MPPLHLTLELAPCPLSNRRIAPPPPRNRSPDENLRPFFSIRLGPTNEFPNHPGDISLTEQQKTCACSQRAFVGPAKVNLRRRTEPRKLQSDGRDHVRHRDTTGDCDDEPALGF